MPRAQLIRFLFVGALNTVVGYGIFAIITLAGWSYPIAIGLATVLGVLFNFQSTGRLVFGGAPLSRLLRFIAVYAVVYIVNVTGVALLLPTGLNVYVANGLMIVPLAVLAFLLQRRFVFGPR